MVITGLTSRLAEEMNEVGSFILAGEESSLYLSQHSDPIILWGILPRDKIVKRCMKVVAPQIFLIY